MSNQTVNFIFVPHFLIQTEFITHQNFLINCHWCVLRLPPFLINSNSYVPKITIDHSSLCILYEPQIYVMWSSLLECNLPLTCGVEAILGIITRYWGSLCVLCGSSLYLTCTSLQALPFTCLKNINTFVKNKLNWNIYKL